MLAGTAVARRASEIQEQGEVLPPQQLSRRLGAVHEDLDGTQGSQFDHVSHSSSVCSSTSSTRLRNSRISGSGSLFHSLRTSSPRV